MRSRPGARRNSCRTSPPECPASRSEGTPWREPISRSDLAGLGDDDRGGGPQPDPLGTRNDEHDLLRRHEQEPAAEPSRADREHPPIALDANLVDEADLPAANSLLRSTANLTTVVGTLLGGIVVAAAGPDVSYAVNAISFAGSAMLLATIPARRLQAPDRPAETGGYLGEVKAGFTLVLRSRALLAVFISWNLVMLANAGVNVSE